MAKRGVTCRGRCTNGHEFETSSKPGRVTWTGPCPREGCGLYVEAHRVPSTALPLDQDDEAAPPPAGPGGYRVIDGYDLDEPEPTFEQPEGDDERPEQRPEPRSDAGVLDPPDPPVGPAGSGDDEPPAPDEDDGGAEPPRRRRRLGRRGERLAGLDHDEWNVIPGIY